MSSLHGAVDGLEDLRTSRFAGPGKTSRRDKTECGEGGLTSKGASNIDVERSVEGLSAGMSEFRAWKQVFSVRRA